MTLGSKVSLRGRVAGPNPCGAKACSFLWVFAFNDEDAMLSFERVWTQPITRIKGGAWKLTDKVVEELRTPRYRGLPQSK